MSSDDSLSSDSEKHAGNQPSTGGLGDDFWGPFSFSDACSDTCSDSDDAHKDKRHKKNPLFPDSEDEDEDKAEEAEKYYMEIAKSYYDISSDYGADLFGGVVKGNPNKQYVLDAARFAVMEYNTQHVEQLALEKVLKVNTVVVAGLVFYITLEASKPDGGTGIYETKVVHLVGRPHILKEFRHKALPEY